MVRLEPFKFALSNAPLPPASDLQSMVDAQGCLFQFRLGEIVLGPGQPCSGWIAERPVTYECEARPIANVVERHPVLASTWRFAYGFRGVGEFLSSTVSGLVWLAYARGTGGVGYEPLTGAFDRWDLVVKSLDASFAVALGREGDFRARYPDEETRAAGEYDTIVTRIDQNGVVRESVTPIGPGRRGR